jgi:pilus assembly protein CpaE
MYSLSIGLVVGNKDLWTDLHQAFAALPVRVLVEQTEIRDWAQFLARLQNAKTDIVILDISCITEPIHEVIAKIKSVPDAPAVAAIDTKADPETILDIVRAGATDFLYPPVAVPLQKALTRLSQERHRQAGSVKQTGKVISFFSAKGGCGATTVACHLGLELPRQTKQHLLLADLDFDAGMVGFLTKSPSEYSVLDAVKNIHRLDIAFWKKLVSNGIPGVEIIPGPKLCTPHDHIGLETLKPVLQFFRAHYDWTVLDLGRGLTPASMAAIECCDEAYLVTTTEIPALHQAKHIVQKLLQSGFAAERLRVVINRMNKNAELSIDELEKVLGHDIYSTVPDDYASLYESYSGGRMLEENSPVRRHLAKVARRIAGIPEEKGKRRFSLFG